VVGDTTTGLIPQGLHPSAAAYLAALKASSYSPSRTEIDAVNNLVLGLVANGIYSKMLALYPIMGGTAATHKWNLINPVDTNGGFRLTFTGTWTHASTGMKGNGTTAFANTFLIPSTSLSITSAHVSVYSRTQLQEAADVAIGCTSAGTPLNQMTMAIARSTTNVTAFGYPQGAPASASASSQTISTGFFCGTRTSAAFADLKITRNGVVLATATQLATAVRPTVSAYIGAANGGGIAANFSAKEFAFASIGNGLTDLDVKILATLVQAYQTSLGRQV